MSNMKIIEIPAYLRDGAGQKGTARKLRVAAYCRVSTEEEEQQGSFEIQKLYYTEKINSTPEWKVAGIYADDGISGVHTKKRDGFNQMIQDCKKRKIDLILTKSISRFARNTLDSIQYVRMLKQMGIAVVFEKENINTATMNSEMILTVLSAFAQAESESISQNVARGKRMGYKHGKFAFPYGRIIGYRKGADGKPEIIPEQAEIIRLIFNSYLQGDSLQSIKEKLETAGALTARGNTAWSAQSIQRILQNEKYCGDVLLQKTFTEDVLTGVHKKNTGQLPQYYIENYHEGIVSKQIFREVQAEIARRNSKSAANQRKRRRGRYNSKYALTERLVCGDCGSPYKRVTWNIHGRKQIVWRCVNRIEYGTKFCGNSPSIPEEELHSAILKAVQDLAANFTNEVAAQINGILHDIQTGENAKPNLQEQLEQTQQEFDRLLEMSLDFDEETPFLDDRLKKLNSKIKRLRKAIGDTAAQQEKASQPEMLLSAKVLQIKEYDDALTARIIEKITVRSRNEIEIRFIGGYKKTMQLT
jgi:site-specific DNA recombinase